MSDLIILLIVLTTITLLLLSLLIKGLSVQIEHHDYGKPSKNSWGSPIKSTNIFIIILWVMHSISSYISLYSSNKIIMIIGISIIIGVQLFIITGSCLSLFTISYMNTLLKNSIR